MKGTKIIELLLGLWLLISPFIVKGGLTSNNVVIGIVIIILALAGSKGKKAVPSSTGVETPPANIQ